MNNFFSRAYVNIPETYDVIQSRFQNLNIKELIFAVAKANPLGDGDVQLYDTDTHQLYEKRTKVYIVQKTKNYILGMPERYSEEDMASFVSLRQLRNLIKAFENSNKRISCYGLVYLYVMYTLLEGKSPRANECKRYLEALYDIVSGYLKNNQDDQLAMFIHDCFEPICEAMDAKNISLPNTQLPAAPRNHPRDDQ